MSCIHVLMQQGYCLCMNNFYRINTSKSAATYIGPVGLLPFRIDAISAPLQNCWSRCISGTQSGQYKICNSLESNML